MTVDNSKDLNVAVGEDRSLQGSRIRNAVPPPRIEELESRIGRGVLRNVKPRGIASKS